MIFKIIKFFVKLGIGIALGIVLLVLIIGAIVESGRSYKENYELPYNDVSYIIEAHQISERAMVGTVHMCAICRENFTKTSNDVNCCCPEHEREYQELYRAWVAGNNNKQVIESYGKKFK